MGKEATLKAVGPYSPDITGLLDYPADRYLGMDEGTKIILTAVVCTSNRGSEDLAHALGFGSWEFPRHCFNAEQLLKQINTVNFSANWSEVAEGWGNSISADELKELANRGFEFIYEPNG